MANGQAPLLEVHPPGYPAGFVAGRSVSLSFFIPAMTNEKLHMVEEVPAKERPRFRVVAPKGKKPFGQAYTPEKTKAWEEHVGVHALQQLRSIELEGDEDFTLPLQDCRILFVMRFNLRKPVSYPKSMVHATKKPDIDNLGKAVLDGLVQANVIEDDNLVTDMLSFKRYVSVNHPAGIEIDMTALPL